MSDKRFKFLLKCFRFDDVRDREARYRTDKIAPIRVLFELVVSSFQQYYTPSEFLTFADI